MKVSLRLGNARRARRAQQKHAILAGCIYGSRSLHGMCRSLGVSARRAGRLYVQLVKELDLNYPVWIGPYPHETIEA